MTTAALSMLVGEQSSRDRDGRVRDMSPMFLSTVAGLPEPESSVTCFVGE